MNNEEMMNLDSVNDVEQLLGKMELQPPSEHLDLVIAQLAANESSVAINSSVDAGRFGWSALVVTALAASMLGVLVGQFVSPAPGRAVVVDGNAAERIEPTRSNLTPVNFNVNAFNLMHGHSKKAEYADCTACHVTKKDAFEGWFYGDHDFFKQHDFGKQKTGGLFNCLACHVIASNPKEAKGDLLPPAKDAGFHAFNGGDCLECHKPGVDVFDPVSKG